MKSTGRHFAGCWKQKNCACVAHWKAGSVQTKQSTANRVSFVLSSGRCRGQFVNRRTRGQDLETEDTVRKTMNLLSRVRTHIGSEEQTGTGRLDCKVYGAVPLRRRYINLQLV